MSDTDYKTGVLELLDALSDSGKFRRDCDDFHHLAQFLIAIRGSSLTHGGVPIDLQESIPTIFSGAQVVLGMTTRFLVREKRTFQMIPQDRRVRALVSGLNGWYDLFVGFCCLRLR